PPKSRFEIDLRKAHAGISLPAPHRLALHICQKHSFRTGFADALQMCLRLPNEHPIESLFELGTALGEEVTSAERGILYDVFLRAIDRMVTESREPTTLEQLDIHWRIDYGPEYPLSLILTEGLKAINALREKRGQNRLRNWSLGIRCSYNTFRGEARYSQGNNQSSQVIDHKGELLNKSPWKTFYRTRDPKDEKLAKELEPYMKLKMEAKFSNRILTETMGYTYESDVLKMAESQNWGIVYSLIDTAPGLLPEALSFQLLSCAVKQRNPRICKLLMKIGIPICRDTPTGMSYDLFLKMVESFRSTDLLKILKFIELPQMKKTDFPLLAKAVAERYRHIAPDTEYDERDLFRSLRGLWTKYHVQGTEDYRSYVEPLRYAFYKTVLKYAEGAYSRFRDQNFEQELEDLVIHFEENTGITEEQEAFLKSVLEEPTTVAALPSELTFDQESLSEINRQIIDSMKFTFKDDGHNLALAGNWGVVYSLIKRTDQALDEIEGFKILNLAYKEQLGNICQTLFDRGLPLSERKENGERDYYAFKQIVEYLDPMSLKHICDTLIARNSDERKLPRQPSDIFMGNFSQALFKGLAQRYTKRTMEMRFAESADERKAFDALFELWIHWEWIDEDPKKDGMENKVKANFYKEILKERHRPFRDQEFESMLKGFVKRFSVNDN
ncbi:MAG: hypothetical protein KDK40_04385, partial [Chlamydiia bacterium]|nr:hypothetical protein [Chlamydiia bacterium]